MTVLGVVLPDTLGPGLVLAFAAGALSFLSPCVLPLVPSYLSLMTGVTTTGTGPARASRTTVLRAALLFVAGYTAVFTALGAGASAIGFYLATNQLLLRRASGLLIVATGLAVAGIIRPRALDRERRFHAPARRLGVWAPPVMGAAFAFGWSPCIGPVLGGILTLAAQNAELGRGVLLLLVYSAGLAVPFIASALALGRPTRQMGWVKRHHRQLDLLSGFLMAGFGILLLTGRIGDIVRLIQVALRTVGLGGLANSI